MDSLDTAAERAPPSAAPARRSGLVSPNDLFILLPGIPDGARRRATAAPAGAILREHIPHSAPLIVLVRARAKQWRACARNAALTQRYASCRYCNGSAVCDRSLAIDMLLGAGFLYPVGVGSIIRRNTFQ